MLGSSFIRPFLGGALLIAAGSALAAAPTAPRAPYREGELLVKYRAAADAPAALLAKTRLSLESAGLLGARMEAVRLPSMTRVADVLPLLRADAAVEYAEPNYLRYPRTAFLPNDTQFAQQWGLRNTGQDNFVSGGAAGIVGADLHLMSVWDPSGQNFTGDGSATVAIVDDGVLLSHEDLSGNLVTGRTFTSGNGAAGSGTGGVPARSIDDHGTLVAGAVGAVGNNGLGVAGAAWNVKLMPLDFDFSVAAEVNALNYARTHLTTTTLLVNGSFGGPSFSQAEHDAICGADSLLSDDVLMVVAAGNEDSNSDFAQLAYPANYDCPNLVAVAATNRQDEIASFSTYGPITNDVAAPGLQIVTTSAGANNAYATAGVSGTSFSSPYVAGVAALLRMKYPTADYREIKARLIEGADPGLGTDFGPEPASRRSAGGRVDALNSFALTARPALVIQDVSFDAPLIPNTTPGVDITLENLWQGATTVTGTLTAEDEDGNASALVSVTSTQPASFGSMPQCDADLANAATCRVSAHFDLSVDSAITGHHYVFFKLQIADAGGYTATRHFIGEIAHLEDGVVATQAIQADIYDEFHTWTFTVPPGTTQVVFHSTSSGNHDVDLLVHRGSPVLYQIALGASGSDAVYCLSTQAGSGNCADSAVKSSRGSGGNETVTINSPAEGTYFVTVVNFDNSTDDGSYTLRATLDPVTGGTGGGGGGGGGGPLPMPVSLLLAAAALLRRRAG